MVKPSNLISIIVPVYNEAPNIKPMFDDLKLVLESLDSRYELVYVNDGSTDQSSEELKKLARNHQFIKVLSLSRNFGKEIATTAGIHEAKGDALIMIDGDGQHPPAMIPDFIKKWQAGAKVVIGVRSANQKEGFVKKYGSRMFYRLFNNLTGTHLVPGSTDFRLIDRAVQSEFLRMTERNRITRGLIDWLGFERQYVSFVAKARVSGDATYSTSKLFKLALNSFISLSLTPLYFSLYIGLAILPLSVLLGLFLIIETVIGDPMGLNVTGSAYLIILILFLVGVVLISQGIISAYLSHIHTETQNRPLFVIDRHNSHRIDNENQLGLK